MRLLEDPADSGSSSSYFPLPENGEEGGSAGKWAGGQLERREKEVIEGTAAGRAATEGRETGGVPISRGLGR